MISLEKVKILDVRDVHVFTDSLAGTLDEINRRLLAQHRVNCVL